MSKDLLDSRVIAALRFVNAENPDDKATLRGPFTVSGEGIQIVRNTHGVYVVVAAPGFDSYIQQFLTAPAVAPTTLALSIDDPSGTFLSRSVVVPVPRDATPGNFRSKTSLFQPFVVRMFPAASARPSRGSAIVRVAVENQATSKGLRNALVLIQRTGATDVLGRGMSVPVGSADAAEALVLVPNIPVTTWGGTAVVETEVNVDITAFVDAAGVATPDLHPNPDDLEKRSGTLRQAKDTRSISSGKEFFVRLQVALS